MDRQKRVMAVHDISCFGRCSLTVALPIISAVGVETSVIPTAVLSTHTGGFEGYTFRDLTDDIEPVAGHWISLDLRFDALYTGFLGSYRQLDLVSDLIDKFKTKDNFVLIDPVMADNGVLYKIFNKDFPAGMRKLCNKADIIVPNMTEAAFLLGEEYRTGPYTREYIEDLVKRLSALGPKKIVLTGVYFDDEKLGAAAYDAESGRTEYAMTRKIGGFYHGTGDVFASALLAALISKKSLAEAALIAAEFTAESILRTKEAATDVRFGVNFEEGLGSLIAKCVGK